MAVVVELFAVLLCLASISGSSDVFRPLGDSVQLDIQRPVPEFHDLLWIFNRTNVVLKYNKEERQTKLYPAYKGRVEFNEGTYSLTLKNLQKTDSGLYEANTSNSRLTAVAQHSLTVLGSKKPSGPKIDLIALSVIVLFFVLTAAIASASPYLTSLIKGAKQKKRSRDNDKNEVQELNPLRSNNSNV